MTRGWVFPQSAAGAAVNQCDQYKVARCLSKLPHNDFTRKIKDFDTFTKMPKSVEDLGKLNVSRPWKVAQSPINSPIWSHCCQFQLKFDQKSMRDEMGKRQFSSPVWPGANHLGKRGLKYEIFNANYIILSYGKTLTPDLVPLVGFRLDKLAWFYC